MSKLHLYIVKRRDKNPRHRSQLSYLGRRVCLFFVRWSSGAGTRVVKETIYLLLRYLNGKSVLFSEREGFEW